MLVLCKLQFESSLDREHYLVVSRKVYAAVDGTLAYFCKLSLHEQQQQQQQRGGLGVQHSCLLIRLACAACNAC